MYMDINLNLSEVEKRFNRLEHNYNLAKMNITLANKVERFTSNYPIINKIRIAVRLKKGIVEHRKLLNDLDGRFDIECILKGIRQLKSSVGANHYDLDILMISKLIDLEHKCNLVLKRLDDLDRQLIKIDKECDKYLSKGINHLIAYFYM